MKLRPFLYIFFCFASLPLVAKEPLPEKVLICGVCKDVGKRLPHTIKIIEEIGSLFSDYRVIVYENNSSDKTPLVVEQWAKKNSRVLAFSERIDEAVLKGGCVNLMEDGDTFRPEMIARARNIVLDKAMDPAFDEFPYIIWLDLDFKIPPRYEGFVEVFTSDQEWDAIFAYGIDPSHQHWDWYAFRDPILYPLGSELIGDYWWKMPKVFPLAVNDPWYPVYSAFGGCGIYKKSSIEGCRYSATVTPDLEEVSKMVLEKHSKEKHPLALLYEQTTGSFSNLLYIPNCTPGLPKITDKETGILLENSFSPVIWRMSSAVNQYPSVCEHVPFHASMIVRGKNKLFIHPGLVFTYGG